MTYYGKILIAFVGIISMVMDVNAYTKIPMLIHMKLKNNMTNRTGKRHTFVDEILQNSKICDKKYISIDSIILNTYKVDKFFINNNSPLITLSLKENMKNMFYINENGESEKLSNTTKIMPNILKNFFVYELDVDMDVDCIVYKSD